MNSWIYFTIILHRGFSFKLVHSAQAVKMNNAEVENLYIVVKNFGDELVSWIDEETGELHDPFETIYGEGYGPGNAAHILAGLYRRFGEEKFLKEACFLLNRVFDKLQHPTDNSRFTDIFLYFWALKAYELLNQKCSPEDQNKWRELFKRLDYSFNPHTTNGYCLLLSTSIIHTMLGFGTANPDNLNHLIRIVKKMQNHHGFIDDTIRRDRGPVDYYRGNLRRYLNIMNGMRHRYGFDNPAKKDMKPIAYHLFCCAVLAEPLLWQRRYLVPELNSALEQVKDIVTQGLKWIDYFVGSDGSFSMTERSRDQFWTAGCYVYLFALRGFSESSDTLINKHLDWWFRFLKEDGTCSITPNYFPNSLRIGFEYYSIMSMYNTLGFSYLFDAAEVLSEKHVLQELPAVAVEPYEMFTDTEVGYAHLRCGNSSAGISLRRHQGGYYGSYCPAMGLFNVVIDGSQLRLLPAPSYRPLGLGKSIPVQISDMLNHGVYEGIRAFRGRKSWGLDFTENADIQNQGDQVILTKKFNGMDIKKSIQLNEKSLEIVYDFQINRSLDKLLVTYPILLSNGKINTTLKIRGSEVTMAFGEDKYRLLCIEGYNWVHHQERYLLSTSGMTSQLYVKVGEKIKKGSSLKCSLLLEKLP